MSGYAECDIDTRWIDFGVKGTDILTPATLWMDTEDAVPREISQAQEDTLCDPTYVRCLEESAHGHRNGRWAGGGMGSVFNGDRVSTQEDRKVRVDGAGGALSGENATFKVVSFDCESKRKQTSTAWAAILNGEIIDSTVGGSGDGVTAGLCPC